MSQVSLPEGDRVYDLYTGVYKPQIIRIALMLDIFTPMAAGLTKAEEIAKACHCETVGIHHLLDYLASIKVLCQRGDEYSLSPEAATFLVKGKKSYAGNLITDFIGPITWESVRESIQTGQPRTIDLDIHFAQDAWIESYRSARITTSLDLWSKVGIIPENYSRLRMLDIACGCGIKSMVMVRRSENVELTCLDSKLVLEVARSLAERWGILSRVRFMGDNLLTADLGTEKYDCCLLGQITHYLTLDQNIELFKRIHRALIVGGKLVLDVPMTADHLDENASYLSLILWANSGGKAYSFEEYRSALITSGYGAVYWLGDRLLSAVK